MTRNAATAVTADAPLPQLLAQATKSGAGFRLQGRAVRVIGASRMPSDLSGILKARCAEIWNHLGGPERDRPSLDLLKTLNIALVVPQTILEAKIVLAEIAADSALHTPAELRHRPGLVGLDAETAALPGTEHRPAVKLKLNGYPAKTQPGQSSDAGLDPHRSRIRLVQLYGGGCRCCVLDTDLVPLDLVAPFLQQHTAIVHNASFELRHFGAVGINIPYFEDSMQAAGLLLGVRHRRLDHAAAAYLGLDLPKDLQISDWSAPYLSPGQLAYAALDAIVAFQGWLKLRLDLIEKHRGSAYLLQRDVARPVVRMVERGVGLDCTALAQQVKFWEAKRDEAEAEFKDKTKQSPPDTPNKVRTYLQKVLPPTLLDTWPRTGKTGLLTTKTSQLRRVAYLAEIQSLLAVTAMNKLISAFGTTLIDKLSPTTGRLHPSYNIAATKAGRFSASEPNVQQLPSKNRAPDFRRCIVAAPGRILVAGDFNMMELRAAAVISNDPVMTEDFIRGVDLHKQTAAMMLGIAYDDVDDDARYRAKPVNFSLIYGAGAAGLVATAWDTYGINMTLEEAEAARQALLQRYAVYANWMRYNHALAGERGIIEIGRLGRVIEAAWEAPPASNGIKHRRPSDIDDGEDDYWVVVDDDDTPSCPGQLKYTLCCNAPVQGACADAAMLALLKVDTALHEASIDGGPVLFVHDEIVLEVRKEDAERARHILEECMTAGFAETFPGAPLNGVISTAIGDNWKEAKP